MKFWKIALAITTLVSSISVNATLITVTQTFQNVNFNDYGVESGLGFGQNITGDWIFKGTVDTTTIDENIYQVIGDYAATVTLTQTSLGLEDVEVLNLNYLYISRHDRIFFHC